MDILPKPEPILKEAEYERNINIGKKIVNKASSYGPRDKTGLHGFANKKGADQPRHPRRLISSFVIHLLESIISKLAFRQISIF